MNKRPPLPSVLQIIAFFAVAFALAWGGLKAGEIVATKDSMTLYFECVDEMNRSTDALESMSFCKGILNEGR